jgi:hypothetical protein
MHPSSVEIGLCATCQNAQIIRNRHGSAFYLCGLWEKDPRFAKYPRLPVLACDGYERRVDPEAQVNREKC